MNWYLLIYITFLYQSQTVRSS